MSSAFNSSDARMDDSDEATAKASIALKVQRIQLGLLYDQLPQGLVATLVNAALMSWILSSVEAHIKTSIWFGLIVLACAARFGLYKSFQNVDREQIDVRLWRNRFIAGALCTAALWGGAGVALFPPTSYQHQAFIGFVLAGMAAGASGSMVADDKIFRAYLVLAIAPYMLRLAYEGHDVCLAMAVMSVAFIAALSLSARKNSRSTVEALRLRFENQDLVASLEHKASQLRGANEALTVENIEREKTAADLLKANLDAEAATRAKTQFLANMSHEIRTPMNGVFGMTDLLMRTNLDERQRKLVKTINESAKALLTIINDILDLSRIESGKFELDKHEFNLRDAVERASDLFASQAYERGLELSVFIASDVPIFVKSDSGRLKQLMLNLVGNAMKFTKHGEVDVRVTLISTSGTESRVRFEVRDTGIGIEKGLREKLFQPFAQAETSINRRFGGTGLGLSIARHLVELMGGSIALESELGKGTLITFELPLEHGTAARSMIDGDLDVLTNARILVIDDRETNRDILKNYLEGAGAEITTAASTADAWPKLVAAQEIGKPYHAAIVDMMMPGENGLEFAGRISSHPVLSKLKIILATSLNWQGDLETVRNAGVEAVLTKPVRRHDLVEATARAVSGTRHPGWRREAEERLREPADIHRVAISARVLLAEDNPVNVEVAREFLTSLGCRIHVASNGLEAVAFSRSNTYDIILMDCQMPIMDGLTAARRIRSEEAGQGRARTPIVAVTANAFAEDRMHCLDAGMDDYLSKPYSERQLEKILTKWARQDGAEISAEPLVEGDLPDRTSELMPAVSDLDMSVIGTLKAGRPDLLARLVKTYLSYAPTALAELDSALADGDFDALNRLAHSLKSSSANLGATSLSAGCRQLEISAKDKNLAHCAELTSNIHKAFDIVQAALEVQIAPVLEEKTAILAKA